MCYIQVKAHQCVTQGYSDVGIKVITTALKYGMPRGGANVIHNWCDIRLHAKEAKISKILLYMYIKVMFCARDFVSDRHSQ